MKYLKINEQLELLKNKRFDELIAYAKEHNLNQRVVQALLSQLKELTEEKQSAVSIHYADQHAPLFCRRQKSGFLYTQNHVPGTWF